MAPSRSVTLLVALGATTMTMLLNAQYVYGATTQPRFYDAVVVEAEGRSGAEPPPSPPPDAGACALPPEPGPCRGYFASFYYDAASGTCKRFTFSGCGGNANRFRTEKACEAACGRPELMQTLASEGVQALSDDAESVEAAGAEAGSVEAGSAGAGDGDGARPADDCRDPRCPAGCFAVNDGASDCPKCECSKEARERLCALPPSRGHCRALLTRWHYDAASGDCARFRFGGCDGNGNNFATREQCLRACAPAPGARPDAEATKPLVNSTHRPTSVLSRLRRYFSKLAYELSGQQKAAMDAPRRTERVME